MSKFYMNNKALLWTDFGNVVSALHLKLVYICKNRLKQFKRIRLCLQTASWHKVFSLLLSTLRTNGK